MDPIKARINEINFLEFCSRVSAIKNRLIDVKLFIGDLSKYIDFDIEKISQIADMIFTPNFKISPQELLTLLENKYISVNELANIYKKSIKTIYRYKAKGKQAALYPRLEPQYQEALDKFMTQYDKFFVKNYQNIFRIGE